MAVCACGFVAAASEVSKALEQASVASSGSAMTDMDDNAETSRRQVEQVPPQEQEKEQAGLKPQVLGSHSPSSVRGSRGVQRAGVCAANHVFTHVYVDLRAHTHACVGECARHCVSLSFPPSPSLSLPPTLPHSLTLLPTRYRRPGLSRDYLSLSLHPLSQSLPPPLQAGEYGGAGAWVWRPPWCGPEQRPLFYAVNGNGFPSVAEVCMYVCMYVRMHARVHVCMYAHVCMYVFMYVCMYRPLSAAGTNA